MITVYVSVGRGMTVAAGEVEHDGETWITAARASHHLGHDVTPALVRDWARRGLVTPVKVDGRNWYRLADLVNAEARTAGRTKPRRADEATPGGRCLTRGDKRSHTGCQQVTCTQGPVRLAGSNPACASGPIQGAEPGPRPGDLEIHAAEVAVSRYLRSIIATLALAAILLGGLLINAGLGV